MADIELVIKISEDLYKSTVNGLLANEIWDLRLAVANATLLPKGHGELKDMGNLQYVFDLTREDPIYSGKDIERAIKSMKSIVEADVEKGEDAE